MTEEEKKELVEEVWDFFNTGGSHAHNFISAALTKLGKHDHALAMKVYGELQDEGY